MASINPDMSVTNREYLRIPRNATFPTLPVPTDFQEYAHAYYLGAKELWETTRKHQPTGVPVPDTLVYPILFLVHHFLELELKSGIELTYSIGHMTGEITDEQDWRSHNLRKLLFLLKANLAILDGVPVGRLNEPTCELIEDMAKFGVLGESLRYPLATVTKKKREEAFGNTRIWGLIPDIGATIAAADEAWKDLNVLISYLGDYEEWSLRTRASS
jgi:hypothetical protein